jgi:hypothetical protein
MRIKINKKINLELNSNNINLNNIPWVKPSNIQSNKISNNILPSFMTSNIIFNNNRRPRLNNSNINFSMDNIIHSKNESTNKIMLNVNIPNNIFLNNSIIKENYEYNITDKSLLIITVISDITNNFENVKLLFSNLKNEFTRCKLYFLSINNNTDNNTNDLLLKWINDDDNVNGMFYTNDDLTLINNKYLNNNNNKINELKNICLEKAKSTYGNTYNYIMIMDTDVVDINLFNIIIDNFINHHVLNVGLGWCQGYMGVKYHMEEAYDELNIKYNNIPFDPPVAKFSKKYYNEINNLNHNKIHDFCFIGSLNSFYERRIWVIEFAKKYFTNDSIFVNTDNEVNWKLLGNYDYSNKQLGFCPKNQINNQSKNVQYRIVQENLFYFQTMCQSKFILCPGGDAPWTFRFYEVLMCKSIPIVESWHHTYRTKEESVIKYEYILSNDIEKIQKLIHFDRVKQIKIIEEQLQQEETQQEEPQQEEPQQEEPQQEEQLQELSNLTKLDINLHEIITKIIDEIISKIVDNLCNIKQLESENIEIDNSSTVENSENDVEIMENTFYNELIIKNTIIFEKWHLLNIT